VASPRALRLKVKALSRFRVEAEISCRLDAEDLADHCGLANRRQLIQPEHALVVVLASGAKSQLALCSRKRLARVRAYWFGVATYA